MVVELVASSSGGGVVARGFRLINCFHFDVQGGSGQKTTLGIIGDCEMGSATLGDYEPLMRCLP